MMKRSWGACGVFLICSLVILTSCGDVSGSAGSGDLALSVAANEAVRVGFPHVENGQPLEFVDGWSVKLDTFALSVKQVKITELNEAGDGDVVAVMDQPMLVDMASTASGEADLMVLNDIEEGRHDIGFSLETPGDDTIAQDSELLNLMRERGWSMVIRGVATPDPRHADFTEPVSFDIGIALDVEYFDCINGVDGTKGVVVAANRQNEAYIYPHLVHLFWDTLGAGNEQLRFDPMARVAGDDNVVTIEDLDGVDLTDPALTDERGIPFYDDAGLLDTYTLGAFVRRAMAESVHFNGIGFCKKRIF